LKSLFFCHVTTALILGWQSSLYSVCLYNGLQPSIKFTTWNPHALPCVTSRAILLILKPINTQLDYLTNSWVTLPGAMKKLRQKMSKNCDKKCLKIVFRELLTFTLTFVFILKMEFYLLTKWCFASRIFLLNICPINVPATVIFY